MNILLGNLIFEAPIDTWLKKNTSFTSNEVKPIIDQFMKFKDYIDLPDPVQYSLEQLKIVVQAVKVMKEQGFKSTESKWVTKQIRLKPELSFKNIEEDYIPILKTYVKNKQELGNIADFKDIGDLSQRVEKLSGEIEHSATENEKDIFYRENGWYLAMPHTTAASCELGSGTTWCTARTKSQNLFLNYVGRGENIILFYVIKDGGNPRMNPTDKISVGFINGEPAWNQGYGGITVDAANDSVTEEQFMNLLGDATASHFIQKMREKAHGLEGAHPAKKEIEKFAVNEKLLQKKLATFKNNDEMIDFVQLVLSQTNISDGVFLLLSENPDEEVRQIVASNNKLPLKIAERLVDDLSGAVRHSLRDSAAFKNSKELQNKMYQLNNKIQNDIHRIYNEFSRTGKIDFEAILNNKYEEYGKYIAEMDMNLPEWVAERLAESNSEPVRVNVAKRIGISEKVQLKLANDTKKQVRTQLLESNPLLPTSVLKQLILNGVEDSETFMYQAKMSGELIDLLVDHTTDRRAIKKIISSNKSLPRTLAKIAKLSKDYYSDLLDSEKTPAETLQLIYDNSPDLSNDDIQSLVARTKTPPNILATLYNKLKETYPDSYSIDLIAGNSNTPPELLQDIYNTTKTNPNRVHTFTFLAQNKNAPANILNDLSNHSEYHSILVKNPNLPSNLVEKIFNSPSSREQIREEALAHPNLPEQFLIKTALDQNSSIHIRGEALKNKNVSYEALKPFLEAGGDLRAAALGNPNIPGDFLRQLMQTNKKSEMLEIASNPSLPKDVMITLAQSDNGLAQLALLNNPNVDEEVLKIIAKNAKISSVRNEASRRLNSLQENTMIKLSNILYG